MKDQWDGARRFQLPADCGRILIVGAGGFGREVLQWARDAWPDCKHLIAGFLSDDAHRLDGFDLPIGVIASTSTYDPQKGDYLILAIGVPYSRRRVAESILARGGRFLTLVHPTAVVADTASISIGSVVCPFAVLSDCARLGSYVLINYHASIGHDACAADFAVLSPYAALGGGARVDEEVFLGLHASVGPGKRVGTKSKVSANSCVLSDAAAYSLIYGVPGRIAARVSVAANADEASCLDDHA